jgi:hypothetical protein
VAGLQRLTQSTGKTNLSVLAINKLGDFNRFAFKEQRCRLPSGHILAFHGLGAIPTNNPAALVLSVGDSGFKGGSGRRQALASSHCSLCFHFVGESIVVIPGATSGPLLWWLEPHEIGDDIPHKRRVYCLVSLHFANYAWAWALFGLGFGHGFVWFMVYPIATHSLRSKGKERI